MDETTAAERVHDLADRLCADIQSAIDRIQHTRKMLRDRPIGDHRKEARRESRQNAGTA